MGYVREVSSSLGPSDKDYRAYRSINTVYRTRYDDEDDEAGDTQLEIYVRS